MCSQVHPITDLNTALGEPFCYSNCQCVVASATWRESLPSAYRRDSRN